MSFSHLSSHALVAQLAALLQKERVTMVDILLHLAEIDRRRIDRELGYPSLYEFCVEHMKLPGATAYRRTVGAQFVARFPAIAEHLRDGRLSMATLFKLRDHLTEENHRSLLDRAAGKTTEELNDLVTALRPAPPVPPPPAPPAQRDLFDCLLASAAGDPGFKVTTSAPAGASSAASQPQPRKYARRVWVTFDEEFAADFDEVRDLLSHKVPDGDVDKLLHECVRQTVKLWKRKRRGGDRAREPRPTTDQYGRYIPAHVRREVWDRDGGACVFVGTGGRCCGSRRRVEFHHVLPYGMNGPTIPENLKIYCKRHNMYAAEKDYGRAFIDEKLAGRGGGAPPAVARDVSLLSRESGVHLRSLEY